MTQVCCLLVDSREREGFPLWGWARSPCGLECFQEMKLWTATWKVSKLTGKLVSLHGWTLKRKLTCEQLNITQSLLNWTWIALKRGSIVFVVCLYKVSLTFKSVDKTRVCDHSNESFWAVLSCGTVYYTVQGGSNFQVWRETPVCDHSNESYWAYFHVVLSICCTRWF